MPEGDRTIAAPFPEMLNWGEMARKCHRCNGTMIEQKFYGPGDPFWGWRCVFSGEILDPLIGENRSMSERLESVKSIGLQDGRKRRRVPTVSIPEIGEVLRHRETGNIFEIRKITSEFVILHSNDGVWQIVTGKKNVFNSFEKISLMEWLGSALDKSL